MHIESDMSYAGGLDISPRTICRSCT